MTAPVIGQIGVGNWGRHILRDLKSLGATVHAVARDETSIERARNGGAASIVGRLEDLPACDGFVIANRTIDHLDAAKRLLPRGRPIYVEKPLSPDVAAVRKLDPKAWGLLFVMHKWRYHPGVLELARIARTGEFGLPTGLRTFRLGGVLPHTDVQPIWILMPHDLSIALEILGEVPKARSASRDPLTEKGGGVIAHFSAREDSIPIAVEVSAGHPQNLRRIVLACETAVCELRDEDYDTIHIARRDAPTKDHPLKRKVAGDMPLYEELRAFLGFVAGGPPPHTSLAEEVRIIEAIQAIQDWA
jgi:predicted dehydrogenase